MSKPLAIDMFCGLGGWTVGLIDAGFDVVGFDIERWPYPGQLVLQDCSTLHGSQFRGAVLIVASPPCQAYSYRAMPWKRAKALPPPSNELFESCFRIQREACEAAGHHIPMVIENVRGAQKWVGRAKWHYGSYYLWGDVPALMPFTGGRSVKVSGLNWSGSDKPDYKAEAFNSTAARRLRDAYKNNGGNWFNVAHNTESGVNRNPVHDGVKQAGQNWSRLKETGEVSPHWRMEGVKQGGRGWHYPDSMNVRFSSRSAARKIASAEIARIPYPLARWIGECYLPREALDTRAASG